MGRLVHGQAEEQNDVGDQANGKGFGAQVGLLREDETVMLARGPPPVHLGATIPS